MSISQRPFPSAFHLALTIAFAVMGLGSNAQNKSADSLLERKGSEGFVVKPYTDTLFLIHHRIGSFSGKARAEAIAQRVVRIGDEPFFNADSLRVDSTEGAIDITYGDLVVMSITEKDAATSGCSAAALAGTYHDAIATAITVHRESIKWTTLAKEVALALLVLAVVVAIIWVLGRVFRRSRAWLERQEGTRIKGLRLRNYELFNAERSLSALLLLNRVIKWLVIILVLYLALPVLFGIFPWTRDLAETLFGYVTTPLGHILGAIWHFLPDLITIVVIFFVFRYAIKGIAFLKDEVARGVLTLPGFYPEWADPTFQILRILLYAFMLVVIFPYLPGSDSPVFRGVTVFLGALFTFGSAGSLSNVLAGLMLTYMRAFRIGDRVKIGEVTGDILEKTLLVTRIRTIKNEIISIPNATVIGSHTTNYSSDAVERGLIIHSTVSIGYDVPWRQVHQLLINAAIATDMIKEEPAPFVLQTSLDDFYVSYQINAYTDQPARQAAIYSQLHQHIQDQFNAAGVEIMSPHYRAMRDGNQTTVSADQVPKDLVTPSFRLQRTDPGQ